jgi:transcriptional regulator with XRE-family HTH domain
MAADREPDGPPLSTEARIGEVLKAARDRRGLSLRTLGARVGFSASFLSQVETGQVSPSLASLERIAHELGLTLAGLFAASDGGAMRIVRAGDRQGFTSSWSRARVESLMPAAAATRSLDAIAVTLAPGGVSGKHPAVHAADQFVYAAHGAATLILDETQIDLHEGDTTFIPRRTPHRWENRARTETQLIIVSTRLDE